MTTTNAPLVYAVPSFRRAETFAKKTLATLQRNGVPAEAIYCFLSDPTEEPKYREEAQARGFVPHFVPSVPGLAPNRNAIVDYFNEGQRIVWLDDDVAQVLMWKSKTKLVECLDLPAQAERAFAACVQTGAYIWGVYAVQNPFFMGNEIVGGLWFLIGPLFGTINRHAEVARVSLKAKEDSERTIKYYLHDGVVLRLNFITIESAYQKEPGGLQGLRTQEIEDASAQYLAKTYPALCTYYVRKTTGRAEVRLKDRRGK